MGLRNEVYAELGRLQQSINTCAKSGLLKQDCCLGSVGFDPAAQRSSRPVKRPLGLPSLNL